MSHEDADKTAEKPDINSMFTLKVDNISFNTTKESLDVEFSKFGKIGDIYIPRPLEGRKGNNRGYAFVRFMERDRMEDAQRALDGKMIDGKEIKILEAKERKPENPKQHMLDKGYGASRYNRRRSRSRSYDRRGYRDDYDDRRRGDYNDRRRGDYDDRASRQNNNYRRRSNSRSRDRWDNRRGDNDRRVNSNDRDRSDRRSRDRSRDRD